MKRQWRPGRILLACLVLVFGALVLYLWPVQPLWRVPMGEMGGDYLWVIGIDETRQIVYASYKYKSERIHEEKDEFREYGLYSGKLDWTLPLAQLDGGSEFSQLDWVFRLSADASRLICYHRNGDEFEIRRFPSCELQHRIKLAGVKPGGLPFADLSNDGKQLLVLTEARFTLINSASGVVELEMEIPAFSEPYRSGTQGTPLNQKDLHIDAHAGWAMENQPVQLSPDQRFVAMIDSAVRTVLVYYLPDKKLIARLPVAGVPRFLKDGKTLVVVPQNNISTAGQQNQPRYYQLTETGTHEVQAKAVNVQGETVCSDAQRLVTLDYHRRWQEMTSRSRETEPAWVKWEWLSDESKLRIAYWLGYMTLKVPLNIYDLGSGRLERSFELSLDHMGFFSRYLHRNLITRDGKVLIMSDATGVTCWKLGFYRPVWFWVTLAGSVVVAGYLGWPRRVKVQKQLVKP